MNADDEMTTAIRAQDDGMKTTRALTSTVLDADHPAARPKKPTAEVTVIGLAASAETDRQAWLVKTTTDTDTAAIDTVIPATKMKIDPLGGIATCDHALAHSDAFTDVAHPADAAAPEKQKPNFNATGRLAAESNTIQVQGGAEIVLKYHEPPEARKPPSKEAWRMYVFKGQDLLETVELGERSCWLVGRERMVVDFPLDHPSCSKQHAVLQFRFVEKRNEYGDRIGKIKPYLIDLESANGSSVNGETIPAGRYVEVMDKDVIRFGLSSREYVLMLPPT
ncbi:hypothetical protein PDIG_81080 [Penicillium digitatum PHI26]|uniref:FHA domain-containing protein n=2 Tax=Penicillium digitatum TaxID=36651 RepID=K9FY07_PEND2|nr:hypothetical protein PDIP_29430 [Penicillium digitatum Pd1]EKV05911.1 hypothetical protein PDIG_81080 [Penicillium digitatum PHI26]EKV17839.1 hypothetical protein PDIP_29430 [Penicillium digitatum Pd1]